MLPLTDEEQNLKLKNLQKILGYSFKDIFHLRRSLTTKARINDFIVSSAKMSKLVKPNELAFLHQEALQIVGDALLDVLILEHAIFLDKVTSSELDSSRQVLGNNARLKQIALNLNLQDYLFLSNNESLNNLWMKSHKLLPDTLEAILGAAFIDRRMKAVRKIVNKLDLLMK